MIMLFIVQGSSRSWAGDKDHCMYEIDGKPAIYHTIKRIYDNFQYCSVIVIAPEFDKDGELEFLKKEFNQILIQYSDDSSPLKRMVSAIKKLHENDFFVRINALNFNFEIDFIKEMITLAKSNNYDCVKMMDDYPPHFAGEVYKVSAIKDIDRILEGDSIENANFHKIHPKFIMMRLNKFNSKYYIPKNEVSQKKVKEYNEKMKQVLYSERHTIEGKNKISSGDQLTYHYELAEKFLLERNISKGNILDIACGTGHGTIRFHNKGYMVYGADYDLAQIEENKVKYKKLKDTIFKQENIINMSFDNNFFDAITLMETIEHVDAHKSLIELRRVLKKKGYVILSTPQNSTTGMCINPQHIYEYSLLELKDLVSQYFHIVKIIGLKAGKIHFDDDPIGANTVMILQKIQ